MIRFAAISIAALGLALLPAAGASASLRTDGRALLKPLEQFKAETAGSQAQLESTLQAVVDELKPCIEEVDSLMQDRTKIETVTMIMGVDVIQATIAVVAPQAKKASRRFARLRIKDRTLRAWSRAKGREIAALLRLQDIDTCTVIGEWRASNYAADKAPDPFANLPAAVRRAATQSGTSSAKATARMRRAGISRIKIEELIGFPGALGAIGKAGS